MPGRLRRGPRRVAVGVALALTLSLTLAEPPPKGAMTDEEVVRLVVAGKAVQAILAEVARRAPAFDVSPEMLAELKTAGVPPAVIDAMVSRMRELERAQAEAAPPPSPPEPALPTLHLVLDPGRTGDARELRVARRLGPETIAEWELGNAPDELEFADIALFLACSTADHVPDQWRLASPLGRDFEGPLPRHRMHVFVRGLVQGEAKDGPLLLELPPAIEVALEPEVAHDLWLGVALEIGGRFRVVAHDTWPGFVLTAEHAELTATVSGHALQKLSVAFLGKPVPPADDERTDRPPNASPAQRSSSETTFETPGSSIVTP